MDRNDFWAFAKRALWIPIVYFGVKGCADSACLEAETTEDYLQEQGIEYIISDNYGDQDEIQGIRGLGGTTGQGLGTYER